jgi:hypothetical protein
MKPNRPFPLPVRLSASVWRAPMFAALFSASLPAFSAPPGPTPQIPDGGGPPGAFPNTSVSAVNVIAKGSTTFNSSVEVTGLDGSGPIAWSVNRYNRGDLALRLAPATPRPPSATWDRASSSSATAPPGSPPARPGDPSLPTAVIPTARQNGPIDWNDGEGPSSPPSPSPGPPPVPATHGRRLLRQRQPRHQHRPRRQPTPPVPKRTSASPPPGSPMTRAGSAATSPDPGPKAPPPGTAPAPTPPASPPA